MTENAKRHVGWLVGALPLWIPAFLVVLGPYTSAIPHLAAANDYKGVVWMIVGLLLPYQGAPGFWCATASDLLVFVIAAVVAATAGQWISKRVSGEFEMKAGLRSGTAWGLVAVASVVLAPSRAHLVNLLVGWNAPSPREILVSTVVDSLIAFGLAWLLTAVVGNVLSSILLHPRKAASRQAE